MFAASSWLRVLRLIVSELRGIVNVRDGTQWIQNPNRSSLSKTVSFLVERDWLAQPNHSCALTLEEKIYIHCLLINLCSVYVKHSWTRGYLWYRTLCNIIDKTIGQTRWVVLCSRTCDPDRSRWIFRAPEKLNCTFSIVHTMSPARKSTFSIRKKNV